MQVWHHTIMVALKHQFYSTGEIMRLKIMLPTINYTVMKIPVIIRVWRLFIMYNLSKSIIKTLIEVQHFIVWMLNTWQKTVFCVSLISFQWLFSFTGSINIIWLECFSMDITYYMYMYMYMYMHISDIHNKGPINWI